MRSLRSVVTRGARDLIWWGLNKNEFIFAAQICFLCLEKIYPSGSALEEILKGIKKHDVCRVNFYLRRVRD